MKSHLIIIASILTILFSSFIGIDPDSRIVDYLGQEKVNIIIKNNPDLIRYYNFFLENSYMVSEVPQDKLDENSFPEIELPLKNGKVDKKKLNVLQLEIQRKYNERIYYKVKNSSEIFIMLSEKEFIEKYNEYRKSLGLIKE
jgi:hypothetical protein